MNWPPETTDTSEVKRTSSAAEAFRLLTDQNNIKAYSMPSHSGSVSDKKMMPQLHISTPPASPAELKFEKQEQGEKKIPKEPEELNGELEAASKILKGRDLFLAFVGMLMGILLVALDQTILSPALPVIASDFNSLDKIGWIASAYFITQVSLLLLYGQLLTRFNRRWVFVMAITIFELGSLICALAPNVVTLIFGRAVAGVGAGGIFVSCLSIIADVTELQDRPKLLGSFGGVFAASSVVGPLLGGAFTDHLTWRWCFWINLPCGVVTILSIFLVIPNTPPPNLSEGLLELTDERWRILTRGKWIPKRSSLIHKIASLDFIGAIFIVLAIVLLVLPLQWGGNQYPWDDKVIIGTFCAFAGALILFILWEWKGVDQNTGSALVPFRLLANPTQIGTCLQAFFIMLTNFLPIHFQVVNHATATQSGLDLLPLMLSIVLLSGISGFIVSATGYYWPAVVIGPIILTVASGLMYTLDEYSTRAKLTGFQILIGTGIGLVLQNVIVAIQANVKQSDIPQATSLVSFGQLIGGVLGIAIAQTIFSNGLSTGLKQFAPEAPYDLVHSSVQSVYTLPESMRPGVIHAYTFALRRTYLMGVPAGALAFLFSFLVKNRNIKGSKNDAVIHV